MNPFRLSTRLTGVSRAPVRALPRVARAERATTGGGRESTGAEPIGAPGPALAPAAVPVPWRIAGRSESGVVEVEQCAATPMYSVRFALAGRGMLGLSLPRTVLPGERLRVALRGSAADEARGAPDAMLVLRWFQPDGTELLWPIAL